ncbi:MAG: hypothetical protein ACRDJ4_09095 [Actinomycetota bacterium]
MRRYLLVGAAVGILFVGACGPLGQRPDLVASGFVPIGQPTVNAQGAVEVPARVVVRNQGGASAGPSKVSVEFTGLPGDPDAEIVVPFTVEGQRSPWFPHTGSIEESGTVNLDGKIVFHPNLHGVRLTVTATADSCTGEPNAEDQCRVKESDETNNQSTAVPVSLP